MDKDFKVLADRYFEGKIAPEDEKALLDYIAQDPSCLAAFRGWEAEWSARPHFDMTTERAWSRFYIWMRRNRRSVRRRRFFMRVSAVAIILMACSAFATWYIADSAPEQYYTLTAPIGSKSALNLPDGSRVWLNAGSTLRYSTRFNDKNRRVSLQGEGYFEVAKHEGADFIVTTRGYDVVVKGTCFDVSAYNDDQYITTTLIRGAVLIDNGNDLLCMKPGDVVKLDTYTGKFTKSRFETDSRAWVQNMAEYSEISLAEIAKLLSRRYAVNIHISSERLRNMKFSVSLRNKETIDDVLDALQRITAMNVCRDGKEIIISE